MTVYSETTRQLVHITMGGFALLLRVLTWQQSAALAVAALAFNFFALAKVAPRLVRAGDARFSRAGLLFYPLSVLLLIVLFRERLDIAAAAWGVLAFGDGFATLAGTTTRRRLLPWNPDKSWNGLAAFFVAGSIGAVALAAWVAPAMTPVPSPWFIVIAPVVACAIAALVETIPIGLDDNLSVPLTAGIVLWLASQIDLAPDPSALASGVLISAPIAVAAWMLGAVTPGGALAGFACAVLVYAGAYLAGTAVLGTALVLTILSSRLGRGRKRVLGIEESGGGRRGAGNILANCLVGAVGGAVAEWCSSWHGEAGALVLVAGIAAGASDTVASEIGKAFGGRPRSLPTFRSVPPGTPGAVTVVGTLAGLAAAAAITWPAVFLWLIPASRVPLIVMACTAGAFLESILATAFEADGVLDNNTLNFLNTAAAAGLVIWWIVP